MPGGRIAGIVSEGDLLRPEGSDSGASRRPWWLGAFVSNRPTDYKKAHGRTARAVMTPNVVTVDEDTPVTEIAAVLERHHIKRVPVVADGRMVGIVSRANLLHGLANGRFPAHLRQSSSVL